MSKVISSGEVERRMSLGFKEEELEIIFQKGNPKIWDLFYNLIKWCDSYTNYRLIRLGINKDFVHFEFSFECFLEDVKRIRIFIRKPNHRKPHDDNKIEELKDFIKKKFKKFNPYFSSVKSEKEAK